jgi:hypothetical protein
MTTVGLFGLAVGRAVGAAADERARAKNDDQVADGLAALGRDLDRIATRGRKRPAYPDVYYLYSVGRTGALYALPRIGGVDWYRWGAEGLLASQAADGAWPPRRPEESSDGFLTTYGKPVDTAFALLFLKRVHMAKDLSAKLPWKPGELNDSVVARLRPDWQSGTTTASPGERKP